MRQRDNVFMLPAPLTAYKIKTSWTPGGALFDIYGQNIITINAVAWTEEGVGLIWTAFSTLFINLQKQHLQLDTLDIPTKPNTYPWLITLILPTIEAIEAVEWLADCEQCFAKALIEEMTRVKRVK